MKSNKKTAKNSNDNKELQAKIKAAEKRGEYKYTKLKDCNQDGEQDLFHFYAVVLDASFPHKSYKSDRFICSLKITDPDQPMNKDGVVEHCTLMMFARKFEDLPIIQRVGEIIRVHRAHVQTYKNVKQFTCNVFFNSSWALFSPLTAKDRLKKVDDQVTQAPNAILKEAKANLVKGPTDPREFQPFAFLGKQFSFEASEKKTITNIREWVAKSFAKHIILSERYIQKLKDIPEVGAKRENGRFFDIDL